MYEPTIETCIRIIRDEVELAKDCKAIDGAVYNNLTNDLDELEAVLLGSAEK